MKISDTDLLIVPGPNNADPGHWQRRWAEKMETATVVEQADRANPHIDGWVDALMRSIHMATRPVVLVGHSLGVATIVHAAQTITDTKVRGGFLVCPPDIDENPAVPENFRDFGELPTDPLPFPTLLIGSATDPWCDIERAGDMGNAWGSEFHSAGDAGRIDTASGHGPWPEGLMMFTRLMQRLKA